MMRNEGKKEIFVVVHFCFSLNLIRILSFLSFKKKNKNLRYAG